MNKYNLFRVVTGINRSHGRNFYINHNYPEFTLYLFDVNNKYYLFTLAVITPIKFISTTSSDTIEDTPYISRTLKLLDRCKINDKLPYSKARYYSPVRKFFLEFPNDIEKLYEYKSNIVSWNDNTFEIIVDKTYLMEDKRFRALENPLEGEFIVRKLHDLQFRHYFHITPEAGNLLQSSFAFIFDDIWKGNNLEDVYINLKKYTDINFRPKVKKHLDKLPRDMLPDYYFIQSKYKIGAYIMDYMIHNIIHFKMISPINNYIVDINDIKMTLYATRFDPLFKIFYSVFLSKYN